MLRILYRLVLWTHPTSVRRAYGREMEEVFVHCVNVQRRRRRSVALACGRGLIDALTFAVTIRQDPIRPEPAPRRVSRFGSPRMIKQDVRSTLRFIYKQPLFAAAVIVTLALGIGVTTAIFSVVDGVLLRSLPF